MDEEIAAAMAGLPFTPAVSQGVIEFSCTARKRVGNFYINRNITVRHNYKVTSYLGGCGRVKMPPMLHINPIEVYRNAVITRTSAKGGA